MHALWRKSAVFVAACIVAACAGGEPTGPDGSTAAAPGSTIETIVVSPSYDTITVGQSVQLTVTTTDNRKRRNPVTYKSTDTTVIRVDTAGLATAVGPGSADVVVRSTVGPSKATVHFVVRSSSVVLSRIQLSLDTVRLATGDSTVLSFHAYDTSGQITWAFDSLAVSWSSTDTTVATVRRSGQGSAVAKARAGGQAHVIVSLANVADTMYVADSSKTQPAPTPVVASVSVALNSPSLTTGQSTQAVATARDSTGTVITGSTTTWTSADTTVATVSSSGLVTARKAGSAAITATIDGKSGSAALSVTSAVVASVTVAANSSSITVGQSTQLVASARDASGNVISGATFTWSSAAPAIASVSSSGLVSGVAAGSAVITATSGTASGSTTISVTSSGTTTGLVATPPELPRVYLNTAMPAVTGKSISVPAGGDLQAAIDQAVPGDEIVLQAGATYTGNFNLPVKSGASTTPGSGSVIVIRSSGLGSLPAGSRVSPASAPYMAKLVTNVEGLEAIGTAPGTAGWRLVGLEITAAANVTTLGRLVRFGDGNPTQNALSQIPFNLILDRSYVHGSATLDVRRCVDLQSGASAVIDSYISDCHSAGSDAQAVCGWNGPGPYKIQNNYLEGSGENVMFGGADPSVPNLVPSDIEIRGNYIAKPVSWIGSAWAVKNLLELKMGHRVLIEGNVLEHAWTQAQVGFALLLKTANTAGIITTDVTVRHNIVNGAAGGVNVAGVDNVIQRVAVIDNLFLDIGSSTWDPGQQNGRLLQWFNVTDLAMAHNTGFAPAMFVSLDSPASPRLDFHDNIVGHGAYGLKGSGYAEGTPSLDAYTQPYFFKGNVVVGGGDPASYPGSNYFASSTSSVGFTSSTDWSLSSGSPYKGKATDGTDPGVNWTQLTSATNGVKK